MGFNFTLKSWPTITMGWATLFNVEVHAGLLSALKNFNRGYSRSVIRRLSTFLVFLLIGAHSVWACSIFCVAEGGKVFVGNNEDFNYDTPSEMWFVPASKDKLGCVFFGWNGFAQGGMNASGLCMDWATHEAPPQPVKSNK